MSVLTREAEGSIVGRLRVRYAGLALLLSAGIPVGIGASAIFVVLLASIVVHERFPRVQAPDWLLAAIIIVLTFSTSVAFAFVTAAARDEQPVWWRTLLVGATLPLAGAAALLVVAARLEPLGSSRADLTLPIFRLSFVSASALIAFSCTLVSGWLFRVPGTPRRALAVAAITAVVYLVVALALDPIPGFHVGGGDRAMPKVTALCNFIARIVGGAAALRALSAPSKRVPT